MTEKGFNLQIQANNGAKDTSVSKIAPRTVAGPVFIGRDEEVSAETVRQRLMAAKLRFGGRIPDSEREEGLVRDETPSQGTAPVRSDRPAVQNSALKRTAEQVESGPEGDTPHAQPAPSDDKEDGEKDDHQELFPPGPIKGFNTERIFKNLDPVVRKSWENQVGEAIFVHYLSGGYSPNIVQNVAVIAEDLMSKRFKSLKAEKAEIQN